MGKSVSIVTSTIPIVNDGKIEGAIEIFKDLTNVVELSEKILMLQSTLYGKNAGSIKFYQNGTQYHLSDLIGEISNIICEVIELHPWKQSFLV